MRKLLLIALLSAAGGLRAGEPAASQADASSQLPAAFIAGGVGAGCIRTGCAGCLKRRFQPAGGIRAAAGCQRRPQPVRTARAVNGFGQQNPVYGKPDPQYGRYLSEPR